MALKAILEGIRELRRLSPAKKAADLALMEEAIARGLPLATRSDFASAMFFQAVIEGGVRTAALLKKARIRSLDLLTNGQIRKLLQVASPLEIAGAMRSMELAFEHTLILVSRQLTPYRQLRTSLFYFNRTAVVAAIGAAATVTDDVDKLREIAASLAEITLFEAAHFYDAALLDGAIDLTAIRADMQAGLNWKTGSDMVAFGLPRAVHRTSLDRLIELGYDVEGPMFENWSNIFAKRIRYADSAVQDAEKIVLHPGSRGWEAVKAFGGVCADAFPGIWKIHQESIFQHFESLIGLLTQAEKDAAIQSWPAYKAFRGLP